MPLKISAQISSDFSRKGFLAELIDCSYYCKFEVMKVASGTFVLSCAAIFGVVFLMPAAGGCRTIYHIMVSSKECSVLKSVNLSIRAVDEPVYLITLALSMRDNVSGL